MYTKYLYRVRVIMRYFMCFGVNMTTIEIVQTYVNIFTYAIDDSPRKRGK